MIISMVSLVPNDRFKGNLKVQMKFIRCKNVEELSVHRIQMAYFVARFSCFHKKYFYLFRENNLTKKIMNPESLKKTLIMSFISLAADITLSTF